MSLFRALFRDNPVRIQPYFGYRSKRRLVLQARALKPRKHRLISAENWNRVGGWLALRTMLGQFASREAKGVIVRLELTCPDGKKYTHEAVTNDEGFVRFDLSFDADWALPDNSAWERATIGWDNSQGAQTATAHLLVPGHANEIGVISDVDDTIIETGINGSLTSLIRNLKRVLAQWPNERIAVKDADVFFAALGGGKTGTAVETDTGQVWTATRRPFFYVSSSPWNLFSYLVAFKHSKDLPLGPLMLRDWGLNRATFGKKSHGGHKSAATAAILAMYPNLRFALIGDDTQADLAAFTKIVADNPGRIAGVFIRRLSQKGLSEAENALAITIREGNVPLWMGVSYSEGHEFLQSLDLKGAQVGGAEAD